MVFGLTSAAVKRFASLPFVRDAVTNPREVTSVLGFFYGVDYQDPTTPSILRKGDCVNKMASFWYSSHKDYDKLCRSFSPVIREAGKSELVEDVWNASIDGKMAQLILTDQLSRNAFRGSDEAFQYDDIAVSIARNLSQKALGNAEKEPMLEGELYGPYVCNIMVGLMHSENLSDHEVCLELLDWAVAEAPEMNDWWDQQRPFALDHKEVIDRFGRYPHRNTKKGRENTPEEMKWLASDDLPTWAKSQS